MNEVINYSDPIVKSGLEVVWRLRVVNRERMRHYPSHIQAVYVLSGPGTYYKRLKPNEPELLRWMDRDRIRAGVAVFTEITKQRIGGDFSLDNQNITNESYPVFVYNGTPLENEVIKEVLRSPLCKLPREKVLLIEEVKEEDGTVHKIGHTGDQVKSFFQKITDPSSPIFGIWSVAVIQHESDFARTLHYFKKYNDERETIELPRLEIYPYALRNRRGTLYPLVRAELVRLAPYFQKGDLADEAERFHT